MHRLLQLHSILAGMAVNTLSLVIVCIALYTAGRIRSGSSKRSLTTSKSFPAETHSILERNFRFMILLTSICAGVASFMHSTVSESPVSHYLISLGWVATTCIAFLLNGAHTQQKRFQLAICQSISALSLSIAAAFESLPHILPSNEVETPIDLAIKLLIGVGMFQFLATVLIPCRAQDGSDGVTIDQQFSTSILQRVTFSWFNPILERARKTQSLELEDLPLLEPSFRAQSQRETFESDGKTPLWRSLIDVHFETIAWQWGLAIIESGLMMVPIACFNQILYLMEAADIGQMHQAFGWICCLAASKSLHVGSETWLQWFSFAGFALPVRSQLSSMIFAKSLRLTPTHTHDSAEKTRTVEVNKIMKQHLVDAEFQDLNDLTCKAASSINLMSVDVQRIYDFCGYNIDLIRAAVKILLSLVSLVSLLGWTSTLAGLSIPLLVQPLARAVTTAYTHGQAKVMANRDNKSTLLSEVLHGIKHIKFSGTEEYWLQHILRTRARELQAQWKVCLWGVCLNVLWLSLPTIVGSSALCAHAWLGGQLNSSTAFTTLLIFSNLETTIGAVPLALMELIDARVSCERIQRYLELTEAPSYVIESQAIMFTDATVSWPRAEPNSIVNNDFVLRNLNLNFPMGRLSVICGQTGAGKSLLLSAIVGEANLVSGYISAPNPLHSHSRAPSGKEWICPMEYSYLSQTVWIENSSLRNAVLSGLPYDHERYKQTLNACALVEDIENLQYGDRTELGPSGVNLSGGQRWRIAFARALYSRAGILILDDLFSALDARVGQHVLHHGLMGELATGRTIIVATHHGSLVKPIAHYVVDLNSEVIRTVESKDNDTPCQEAASEDTNMNTTKLQHVEGSHSDQTFSSRETHTRGGMGYEVYRRYMESSGGSRFWISTLTVFALAAATNITRSYWLASWTNAIGKNAPSHRHLQEAHYNTLDVVSNKYLMGYVGLATMSVVLISLKIGLISIAAIRAARQLFACAIRNVTHAEFRWLNVEPHGRILNRFVGDFTLIDGKLDGDLMWCTNGLFALASIGLSAICTSVWLALPVITLGFCGFSIMRYYLDAARDLKRMESIGRSPIFDLIRSVEAGMPTIRAAGRTNEYIQRMDKLLDEHARATWYSLLSTQWMRFRQGLLGSAFTLCITASVFYLPIGASFAGFCLGFAMDYASVAELTVSRYSSVELDMSSVQRILEYNDMATEMPEGAQPPKEWPSEGRVKVESLHLRYAESLSPVLTDVGFNVLPTEKLGIVGRTGSGKSSLLLAILRCLQAHKGSIWIDGIDLASLKLKEIRCRIAMIPQDPVLFSGTIRSNLDPFDRFTDEELLNALQRVRFGHTQSHKRSTQAKHQIHSIDLSSEVAFGGSNLSQGKKQLLCLARAILTRRKILILDEATSAVDHETDALVQETLRQEFSNTTLLVVAHRISSVADFDKILVLGKGKVIEYGSPRSLASTEGSIFRRMVQDSNDARLINKLLSPVSEGKVAA